MTGSEILSSAKKTCASLQEELQKVLLERHKERLAERCVEQLAQLKEQLAEEWVDALGEAERMSQKILGTFKADGCLLTSRISGDIWEVPSFGVDPYDLNLL